MAKVDRILDARQKTHGDFETHAYISQCLKIAMRMESGNWAILSNAHQEALEMIVHKIARILNGNPDVHDHWDDIAGYATLASKAINEENAL